MNLSFDLQLFADITVTSGVSYGDKTFNIEDVNLSGQFTVTTDTVAGFKFTSTNSTGLGVATMGTSAASDDIVFFRGADKSSNATVIGVQDNGTYTWDLNTTMTAAELGKGSKVRLWKMGTTPTITLNSAGGQSIELAGSGLNVALANEKAASMDSAVVLKGGIGNVSLLTGSSVKGAAVSGGAGAAISLTADNSKNLIFNLKGEDAEAFVNFDAAGSTIESSKVEGFTKITYKGGAAADSLKIDGIKNSAVSIFGGANDDSITFGSDVKGYGSITVNGGAGDNAVTLSGTGNEIVVMANQVTGTTNEVTKWTESNGDKEKGNTISLAGSMDTFLVGTVKGGQAQIAADSTSTALAGATATTLTASSGTNDNLSVNIMASDDTYSALLFGKTALASTQGIKFDNYDYMIADSDHTLDLGTTNKKTVVLANTLDEHHWNSTNVYKNVTTIKSSSAGGSLIINGVDSIAAKITANGKNDSIWGGNNTLADTIDLAANKDNVNVFSGANDGLDIVDGYNFSTTLAKSSVIRFLDGVEYVTAGNGTLTIGKDDSNAAVINFTTANPTGGNKLAYAFGTEGEKYVAGVDTSADGKGPISYDSLASVYIGQGDSSISVGSAAKDVKLGWDGGAGYIGIAAIDGTMAADGAVIVGVTDTEQTIAGSSRGASSISGGFVADEWTDTKSDVLIGGGVDTRSTTFFVGKDMGRDEIQKLSGKDNIVFLGTKYSDLDNFKYDASDTGFVFKFGSNTVTADVGTNKKLSNIKDVSLYFDDGTYVWDGAELTKAE